MILTQVLKFHRRYHSGYYVNNQLWSLCR